jgi:hypothetical protein
MAIRCDSDSAGIYRKTRGKGKAIHQDRGKPVLVHVLVHANLPDSGTEEIGVYEYVYEYAAEKV